MSETTHKTTVKGVISEIIDEVKVNTFERRKSV